MQTKTINQLAVGLSCTAGALDFCAGLGFIGAPALMLHLMGVKKFTGIWFIYALWGPLFLRSA